MMEKGGRYKRNGKKDSFSVEKGLEETEKLDKGGYTEKRASNVPKCHHPVRY